MKLTQTETGGLWASPNQKWTCIYQPKDCPFQFGPNGLSGQPIHCYKKKEQKKENKEHERLQ